MELNDIMKRIRKGEDEAFAELVHPHIERAYRTSYSLLGSKELAEEVVQNSMLEAYRYIKDGKEIQFFPTWFSRLVSHRSIDMMRKIGRLKESELETKHHGHTSGAMDEAIINETRSEIEMSIHSLENSDYRNVLLLYYYQEHTVQEVAEMLCLNPSTVKSHLRRARIALKERLMKSLAMGVN
ncbi:RNA polymerase sigma factor [Lysinibacillus sp. BW-2-10]|uniref:RNA polymerase sigma factor n=1 Tax=Lysinibacillus sp. BW-2-10 TaxID=2590030 RepID=UPI00117E4A81|nr:RNA polymerase sigma factor [Lysinibacillus sp. BW-2-10]TSI04173.1 RNA polymerase sigma factor [Lysinibacillus sp. BW-2-10]